MPRKPLSAQQRGELRDERERQRRAKAYREFRDWATRDIADAIIRAGFGNLGGCVDRIVQSYAALMKEEKR